MMETFKPSFLLRNTLFLLTWVSPYLIVPNSLEGESHYPPSKITEASAEEKLKLFNTNATYRQNILTTNEYIVSLGMPGIQKEGNQLDVTERDLAYIEKQQELIRKAKNLTEKVSQEIALQNVENDDERYKPENIFSAIDKVLKDYRINDSDLLAFYKYLEEVRIKSNEQLKNAKLQFLSDNPDVEFQMYSDALQELMNKANGKYNWNKFGPLAQETITQQRLQSVKLLEGISEKVYRLAKSPKEIERLRSISNENFQKLPNAVQKFSLLEFRKLIADSKAPDYSVDYFVKNSTEIKNKQIIANILNLLSWRNNTEKK